MKMLRRIAFMLVLLLTIPSFALATPGVIEFTISDNGGQSDSGSSWSANDAASPSGIEVEIPTATLSPQAAALPWNLALVNRNNPVADGYQPTLMTLSNGRRIDERIYPELQAMFDDCRAAGLKPMVMTAYRTYDDQKEMLLKKYRSLKNSGISRAEAQRRALMQASYPGYSEHQLGLAVDIDSSNTEKCSNSSVWEWMKRNCHKYGFIWRYPGTKSEITGIENEDWHFRYVGVEAATYIMENELCLEEYLQQLYGIS